MQTLQVHQIENLPDLMSFVSSSLDSAKPNFLWFRGTARASFKLLPTLYRHPGKSGSEDFFELEEQIMTRFSQQSIPFQTRELTGDWEPLFYMQHFGVPTRLLDWTENPLVALFFALTGAIADNNPEDAVVWVVNPVMWNKHLMTQMRGDRIFSPGEEALKGFVPHTPTTPFRKADRNTIPVFMNGTYNSPRIVAQRGGFSIFGTDVIAMEDVFVNNVALPNDCLVKLVIPLACVEALLISITSLGITDSVIYPDMEGLGKETKRYFGFNK
ncbi:FRG domain-containing protein [Hymenobacter sp. B1770]|uniref:FRG domain-containing protein n=1 Tax=Hymenobacter sp. B1770 TaxID=1718788 RepID=UPI003CF86A36